MRAIDIIIDIEDDVVRYRFESELPFVCDAIFVDKEGNLLKKIVVSPEIEQVNKSDIKGWDRLIIKNPDAKKDS